MSDLVGNPEDRFSHNEAQIKEFKSDVERLIKSYLELSMQDSRDEHFEPPKPSIYVDTGVWLADVGVQNDFSLFWSKTWLYIMGVVLFYFFRVFSIRKDFLLSLRKQSQKRDF